MLQIKAFFFSHRAWLLLPAVVYFVVALSVRSDYAVTWDEPIEMDTGELASNYVLCGDKAYLDWRDKDYGVALQMPLHLACRLANAETTYEKTLVRRCCLISLFTFFLIVFAVTTYWLTNRNVWLGVLASMLMMLAPRIFAHSVFNTKDIGFMCMYFLAFASIVWMYRKQSLKSVVLCGLFCALAVDTRILGIETLLLAMGAMVMLVVGRQISVMKGISFVLVFLCVSAAAIYLFRPVLWGDPMYLLEIFANMSKFRWDGEVLYLGEIVKSTNLPWHYLPVWMSYTTPLPMLVLGIAGLGWLVYQAIKNFSLQWITKHLLWLLVIAVPICSLAVIIVLKSVVYDGWRHVFFIFPFVVLSGIYLLYALADKVNVKYSSGIVLVLLVPVLITSIINHTRQQTYFNALLQKSAFGYMETDYWGAANMMLLDKLTNLTQEGKVSHNLGGFDKSVEFFNDKTDTRFRFENNPYEADFVIHSFRWGKVITDPVFAPMDTTWAYGNPIAVMYKVEKASQSAE